MSTRIDPNNGAIQDPYLLFRAILQLADDESVAVMRQSIQQLSTRRLENVCSEELVVRQRARNEADIIASTERAAQERKEQAESRAMTREKRAAQEADLKAAAERSERDRKEMSEARARARAKTAAQGA